MKRFFKRGITLLLGTGGLYLLLLVYPNFLFSHHLEYKNFKVYSDRAIPISLQPLLDTSYENLKQSELFEESDIFYLYFCYETWRFTFFTRNKMAGGVVNFLVSPNIFIRESDIENNEIIPPNGWMLSRHDRPLTYFISHEATHSLERKISPFLPVKVEPYILEGYGDYIAKKTTFDFEHYRNLYLKNDLVMDPKNGLYNKYHLYIAYLMEVKKMSFLEIIQTQPDLETTLSELKNEK
jgi:hypothetical protein